jgi:hypothetical protein
MDVLNVYSLANAMLVVMSAAFLAAKPAIWWWFWGTYDPTLQGWVTPKTSVVSPDD